MQSPAVDAALLPPPAASKWVSFRFGCQALSGRMWKQHSQRHSPVGDEAGADPTATATTAGSGHRGPGGLSRGVKQAIGRPPLAPDRPGGAAVA
jgi:hypothetical protein